MTARRSSFTPLRNVETVMIARTTAARGRSILCVVAAAFAAACGDSTSPKTATPATITAVSGAGQAGSIGTPLASPIVFEVTTAADAPVAGVTVSFSVTAGSATVSPSTAVTDANGTASAQLTLGSTAGAVELTATVRGGTLSARATATATQTASTDCSTATQTLTLGQVVTGLGGASLCVAGGTSGGDYALVPYNASLDGSSSTSLTVQASGVGTTPLASLTPG